ncbi:glycosyltransferase family 4 protein [Deinococcus sp. YIM 134068]|uniref:glycosyltransferase family 4 protein n=1 Tax=Deinococcus lichenicola TaxID=3118910 RepID=UPI002F91CE19
MFSIPGERRGRRGDRTASGGRVSRPRVLWIGTSARGGMYGYVVAMRATPLFTRWRVGWIATHDDGSAGRRLGLFASGMARFVGQCLTARPQVVHIHSSAYGSFARKGVLLWLSSLIFRLPTVLHLHAGEFLDFYRRCPAGVRPLVRATLARADRVVTLSPHLSADVTAIAPTARVLAVRNGIALTPAPPRRDRPPQVLFLGVLVERKNPLGLLRAWARVERPPGARLRLAGDGPLRPAVEALVAELGLADSVELLGWVDAERSARLLEETDILVLPSYFEGQPLALIEGMARGVALVSTHVGGIPDLIENGVSGLLVPPGDDDALAAALAPLLADGELRRRLGDAAYEHARQEFNIEHTWHQLDALYRELAPHVRGLEPLEAV